MLTHFLIEQIINIKMIFQILPKLNKERSAFIVFLLFLLLNSSYCLSLSLSDEKERDVYWLHSGENYTGEGNDELGIYCRCKDPKSIISLWRSAYVEIKGATDFTLFEGSNSTEVVAQYKAHLSSWIPFSPWRHSQVSLSAFDDHCIGITSSTNYKIQLNVRKINYWKLFQMLGGAILFFTAPTICRNSFFYYTSGVSIGIIGAALLIFIVLSRFIPKKTTAYTMWIAGGSITFYIFQKLWFNIQTVVERYSSYLICYVVISALISFAICYRYQPMTDSRSQDLIQWAFQLIGLALVFFSSEFHEVSLALAIILVLSYNIPALWIANFQTWWKRKFPPKVKFLTEMEYMEQANRETRKAIEELRKFCDSPDCKSWKYVSRLKNPIRFAKFVEGDSHLTDDEILKYDSDSIEPTFTENLDDVEITDDEF